MQVMTNKRRYDYFFRHDPMYRPQRGEKPRGVRGKTEVVIRETLPDPSCPFHVQAGGYTAKRDECTCELLRSTKETVYCSLKEAPRQPAKRGVFRLEVVPATLYEHLTNVSVVEGNPGYDPAYGRRQAFEKALNCDPYHPLKWPLSIFSSEDDREVRQALWRHFLTHVTQPIDIPAQPAKRIYRKLKLSEAIR